jgi:hypothetical protein
MAYDDRSMQLLPDDNHQIAEIRGTAAKRADDERRRRKDVSILMIDNVMRFYFFIPTSALSCFLIFTVSDLLVRRAVNIFYD